MVKAWPCSGLVIHVVYLIEIILNTYCSVTWNLTDIEKAISGPAYSFGDQILKGLMMVLAFYEVFKIWF